MESELPLKPTPGADHPEAPIEFYKASLQIHVEDCKHKHALAIEKFKSVGQYGQNAMRTLFLMNGGAAAALLAFIGHLATNTPAEVPKMSASLTIFVVGLALAGAAGGIAFFSTWLYAYSKKIIQGHFMNVIAALLSMSSLIAFCYGIDATYTALSTFKGAGQMSNKAIPINENLRVHGHPNEQKQ